MRMQNKFIKWALEYLISHGYAVENNLPKEIQNSPWSYVARFSTSDGYIYLKQTPKLIGLEPKILQVLRNQFHASVPEVVAENEHLNCFLMKDGGDSLRSILKKQFDVALVCKAIDRFTLLQLAVADHVNIFIDIGVPDWRLDKIPDLYIKLLAQKNLLLEDGLSEIEIEQLEALIPEVTRLCNKLSSYSIQPSIVQPDFNDNNSLIDNSANISIIDLGEIAISHPFFSLLNCLQQMKKHYGLRNEDHKYRKIKDACLKNYLPFESRDSLLMVFKLAYPLWFVYGALAGERLMMACGKSKIMAYQQGKFISSLRDFMEALNAIDSEAQL